MNKFNKLYESIMGEGKEDAPNYRKAEQKDGHTEPKCTSCEFNNDGECTKFDFIFDKNWTCDAYQFKFVTD